ncbi:hypothetical protein CTI12_AA188420 [Artemisia annua]|uniref:RNA-directed DNA polymerase, eukaryota, Reverse transcriptase zinc-binding domain protein n=1 Tax=Artemisia annua TaxID=35608 RepID=A0A2U1P631_ARTAN|nr:hypothetical protein CTI12_AA188420 [Artemisia annua]
MVKGERIVDCLCNPEKLMPGLGMQLYQEDSDMANIIGCREAKFPFKYLGVPVPCNMTKCSNWNAIIQKKSSYLLYVDIYDAAVSSKKLESLCNNFFISADKDEKKMTWVRWKKCLASKKLGGLGIDLVTAHEVPFCLRLNALRKKIENGVSTRFWEDIWRGNHLLKTLFPRIYLLNNYRDCFILNRLSVLVSCSALRRQPRGGVESAQLTGLRAMIGDVVVTDQVALVRALVNEHTLDVDPHAT